MARALRVARVDLRGSIDQTIALPAEPSEQLALRLDHLSILGLTQLMIVPEQVQHAMHHENL